MGSEALTLERARFSPFHFIFAYRAVSAETATAPSTCGLGLSVECCNVQAACQALRTGQEKLESPTKALSTSFAQDTWDDFPPHYSISPS